jgi:hypothetical protein
VWKSEDGGESWSSLTDDQSSQAVGAIAIDPQSPETVYVGLGEGAAAPSAITAAVCSSRPTVEETGG